MLLVFILAECMPNQVRYWSLWQCHPACQVLSPSCIETDHRHAFCALCKHYAY